MEPGYRGVALTVVRGWLRDAPALESRFLDKLTLAERTKYGSFTATEWLPLEVASRFYEEASPLLCPADPSPVRTLGRRLAGDLAQGVHRHFFKLVTARFMVTSGARLWPLFHRTGSATVERVSERATRMEVVGYPALTATLRTTVIGYMGGLMELTGARGVAVAGGGTPARWTWTVSWGASSGVEAEGD